MLFELTKCIYLWWCIFIHFLYIVFLLYFILFLRFLQSYYFLLLLQMETLWFLVIFVFGCQSASLTQNMWTCAELPCGPTNKCITVRIIGRDNCDQIFITMNPTEEHQGYIGITKQVKNLFFSILWAKILRENIKLLNNWGTNLKYLILGAICACKLSSFTRYGSETEAVQPLIIWEDKKIMISGHFLYFFFGTVHYYYHQKCPWWHPRRVSSLLNCCQLCVCRADWLLFYFAAFYLNLHIYLYKSIR